MVSQNGHTHSNKICSSRCFLVCMTFQWTLQTQWTPYIIHLSYNSWWPMGWYVYLMKTLDFLDCVWHFTGWSTSCICPLVNSVHWNVTHSYLQFCLNVFLPFIRHHALCIYLPFNDNYWWVIQTQTKVCLSECSRLVDITY